MEDTKKYGHSGSQSEGGSRGQKAGEESGYGKSASGSRGRESEYGSKNASGGRSEESESGSREREERK